MRHDRTFEPMNESTDPPEPPVDDEAPRDPYEELENVFDEPILLEDADFPAPERPLDEPARAGSSPEQLQGALEGIDEITSRLWARLGALEGEIRRGSERTLEALRRLGERMGAELAMLDKRAINLELTVARLRAVTEAVESATRRAGSEPSGTTAPAPAMEPPPPPPPPMWDPPRGEPEASPQAPLPGTQPEPPDWRHPSLGPPLDDEPPDDE